MLPMSKSEIRPIITLLNCICKVHDNNLPGFSPGDIKNAGLVSSEASLTSWGEGVSLALVDHPSSDACFSSSGIL